ncbi:unnamed protein product [Haemonchus placei]|uniref:Transmembrane protein n=1 Tax=Haemonchus placei TaxID=6290 RepID=A0A0N4WEB5_HAEPC|nr:unnamed protein product [Haemonchus placei]
MSLREELSFVNVSEDVRLAITTASSSIEIFIYIVGLFISFTFLCALCFSTTLHVNLRVVLGSLTLSLCLTAICKVSISISKIIHTGWSQHDIDVLIFLWRICMPSVEKKLRAGIMLLFYIICISTALLIIYFVHRYNFSNWKKRRGLMIFSESYQVGLCWKECSYQGIAMGLHAPR